MKMLNSSGEIVTAPSPVARLMLVSPNIRQVNTGELLRLEREPDNPHDRNAVKVCAEVGELGYIPRTMARLLAPVLDAGYSVLPRMADGFNIQFRWPREAEAMIADQITNDLARMGLSTETRRGWVEGRS